MVSYKKLTLNNGLRIIIHEDLESPFAIHNTLYNVGSRNENPQHTGLAHFFEHLMFGGSKHVEDFDEVLQMAGGENNAFTSTDITNYYNILPYQNIQTSYWVESDRMQNLNLSNKSIEVQRQVVCEEFKEHYLNQPYGDVWHILMDMCYQKHPYKYPVIGKELGHIQDVKTEVIRDFYNTHYQVQNAIMVIGGNVKIEKVVTDIENWFGGIKNNSYTEPLHLPLEPFIKQKIVKQIQREVPANALYKAWLGVNRNSPKYYAMDMLTDMLGHGKGSRLYQYLVVETKLCSDVDCYHTGSIDQSVIVIETKLHNNISYQQVSEAIDKCISKFVKELDDYEWQRCMNKAEAQVTFNNLQLINRCMDLAYFELLGDAEMINKQIENYANTPKEEIVSFANEYLIENGCFELWYGQHEN